MNFHTVQITTRSTKAFIRVFLENYITLHAIPRVSQTDKGSGSVANSIHELCRRQKCIFFLSVGMHRVTGLVKQCVRIFQKLFFALN